MAEKYNFQVNLGGMLDILSNHLYKTPDVFLRELMQNGIDAITQRVKRQKGWREGYMEISCVPGKQLIFTDNGAGLTEEEIHRFLAVIGQSSKSGLIDGYISEDYIGRFGIGLLSCFMVSDTIEIQTCSMEGERAYRWVGYPDGTYTLEPMEAGCPVGTSVFLRPKDGSEEYYYQERVKKLVRYYGLALPNPIYLKGNPAPINSIPKDFAHIGRGQLLDFGQWLFDEEFIEAIPIQTPHLYGAAYVLPWQTDVTVKQGHRIYLKNMLLTTQGSPLLPEWAFFLRCFLNTKNLRPTASRENFYEDEALGQAREEFGQAVKEYLAGLARTDSERLERLVSVHRQAIKSMAVWDQELFTLFIDYLSFPTSEGEMSGAAIKRAGKAVYISDVPRFKQLKPLFVAQGRLLICTGYTSDAELIKKMITLFHLPISPLQEESMDMILKEVSYEDSRSASDMLQIANQCLKEYDCRAELRQFQPTDMPALYQMSDDVQFLRQVQGARDNTMGVFSDALSSLLMSVSQRPLASLYLNWNSELIRNLMNIQNEEKLKSVIRILYVQAMVAGGHSVHREEMQAFNEGLVLLIQGQTAGE